MPIQPISFDNSVTTNPFLEGLKSGFSFVQNAREAPEQLKAMQLANALKNAVLPYAGLSSLAKSRYSLAMANNLEQPNRYLKYLSSTGKTLVEPDVVRSLIGMENQQLPMNGSMGSMNPMMRNDQNLGQSNNPNIPNQNLSNNLQNDRISDIYGLKTQKDTTDTDTRKRNLFLSNIEKTLGQINPEKLTQYSGLLGGLNKTLEQGKSALGYASPEYSDYVSNLRASKQLAKQVRQFYGDSIQKGARLELEKLTNPETWTRSPELAKKLFEDYANLLKLEGGTYRGALQSTRPYKEESNTKNLADQLRNSKKAQEEGLAEYSVNGQNSEPTINWKVVNGKLVREK